MSSWPSLRAATAGCRRARCSAPGAGASTTSSPTPAAGLTIGNVQNDPAVLGPGLDIRGDGGYVLLAPSGHVSRLGGTSGSGSSRPDELPLPALPAWLLEKLTRPGRRDPAGGGFHLGGGGAARRRPRGAA